MSDDPAEGRPMSDTIRRQHRFTVTPEHLILDPRLSDRAFRLWCRLDRFAGDQETAFPTRETLSIELDCSPSSIDRATKELVEARWLKKERRAEGDTCLYTLIVAPEKEVERLIRQARQVRVDATAPRRDAAREKRRAKKRGRGASAQATEGGLVTSDETPDQGGVVTGDETPVVTGDERGLVTSDKEKEATPEGSNREGLSSSPTAGAADDHDTEVHDPTGTKNDRPEVIALCEHLQRRIIENGCKPPTITKTWLDAARLMLDNDGREPEKAHNLIDWCQNDGFWRTNILSMPKFREKYDQLRLRALEEWEARKGNARKGHDDNAAWGRPEDRPEQKSLTDDEAAAMFSNTPNPRHATG